MNTRAVFLSVALLFGLSACDNPTAGDEPAGKKDMPRSPRMFTGQDSAHVAMLEARIAALEGRIIINETEATRFFVNSAETMTLENTGSVRSASVRGRMKIAPLSPLPSNTPILEVEDGSIVLGNSGFYPLSLLNAKNRTSLYLAWARPNPFPAQGYTVSVSDVVVGGADSGGSGYRTLRIAN